MLWKVKTLFLFQVFVAVLGSAHGRPEPFSKIVITSDAATFSKEKHNKTQFYLQYKNNVSVTFADGTIITAQLLDAFLDKSLIKEKKTNQHEGIKKIIFKKNVFIKREKQSIRADEAEIIVPEKLCKLRGNIKIEDLGDKDKKIPFHTSCDRAQFAWDSEEIKLFGNADEPVSTIIKLEGRLKKRTMKKREIAKRKKLEAKKQ
jgi:lipopolysaccharide assembly outer membrane protein LptD (OstA)